MDRRTFLTGAAGAVGAILATNRLTAAPMRSRARSHIGAIAFDAFPILDPRPIDALAEELTGGRGAELMAAWRARQFEYTWLRTLGDRYLDFWQVTEDALEFALGSLDLDLTGPEADRLMEVYTTLDAWPDVEPALDRIRGAGIRMAFLSNFTAEMLDAGVRTAGLEDYFEEHLTTDRVRAFKPDPRAYGMAEDHFELPKEEIAFAAFAGWDAAGASWYGFPTVWVNRAGAPIERLGVELVSEVDGLAGLADVVLA